jgi:hypothetical protein
MAKIAHQNNREDDASTQARQTLDQAARAAGKAAVAETDRLARAASGDASSEVDATSIMEILGDQTRHSFEAATALGRAHSLAEVAQVQSDFIGGSFGRMGQLSERYLALLRGGIMSLPAAARR